MLHTVNTRNPAGDIPVDPSNLNLQDQVMEGNMDAVQQLVDYKIPPSSQAEKSEKRGSPRTEIDRHEPTRISIECHVCSSVCVFFFFYVASEYLFSSFLLQSFPQGLVTWFRAQLPMAGFMRGTAGSSQGQVTGNYWSCWHHWRRTTASNATSTSLTLSVVVLPRYPRSAWRDKFFTVWKN